MEIRKDRRTSIRWSKDNYNFVNRILKKYYQHPKYNLNHLINHLVRQHILTIPKNKTDAYTLKIDLLELATEKLKIEEKMRSTQIILETKMERIKKKRIEEMIEYVREAAVIN